MCEFNNSQLYIQESNIIHSK